MKRTLKRSARALIGGVALLWAGTLAAQEGPDTDENIDSPKPGAKILEPFEVTGSRVKRLDYETPSPVVTYTAATIEEKNYSTLGEFLQSLPFNSSTANSDFTAGSFITGAATINPRGMGSNRVLTLIDGRRGVPYALQNSSSGTPQTVFNFNSIPPSAIDRIEYLKDGASAIYGSDAITGVFNLILKKNYSGTSVDFGLTNTLKHDSLDRRVGVFTGFQAKGWNITFAGNYESRHANFLPDFGIDSTDYRYLGPKGSNFNNVINHPAFLQLTAANAQLAGLGTAAGYYLINNPGTANPTKASFRYGGTTNAVFTDANRYNVAPATQVFPARENYGGYVTFNRILTPTLTAFGRFGYARGDTHIVLSPYFFTTTLAGLVIPANNPYNPLGIPISNTAATATWSFASAPPRREVSTRTETALLGLRGTVRKVWNWESGLSFGRNTTTRDTDLIDAADLQKALSGTTRATAYNPFGPSDDPELERRLFTRSRGLDGVIKSITYDLSLNGKVWQMPWEGGGELGLATGYEHRYDHLTSEPEPNNFLGFSGVPAYHGSRDVDAVFAEVSAPVTKWLELQVAGRHERYSDFGRATKPKYAAKVRLPSNRVLNVIIRGSYSESFKAPDIGQLYAPISRALSSSTYRDPLRTQDPARQLSTRVGGNPALKPEEGKVKYGGFVFEVPAVKGLHFSADYFDIQVTNKITTLTPGYLLTPEGRRDFPNAIIRDNTSQNPGPIIYVDNVTNNLGLDLFRGWDFGLRYALRNTRLGTFGFSADATNITKRGSDAGQGAGFFDNTGLYFDVEWRYNYSVTWRYKTWGASVAADVIGKFFNDRHASPTLAGWGENAYAIFHPAISYRGFKKTVITVSSNNVFDHRPPVDGLVQLGFDDRAYANGALGRTISVRVRREF